MESRAVLNRDSIMAHGLDWTRMGAAPGIAASEAPKEDGVFLCLHESDFFLHINNTGGPVDVWAVNDIDKRQLITTGSGFSYLPTRIPRRQLTLLGRPAVKALAVGRKRRTKRPLGR